MMKVGIYSPYPDILGGGERYLMTIAECLSLQGHQVDIFWADKSLKNKLANRFSLDLGKVNFVRALPSPKLGLFKKRAINKQYDTLFFVSDGSLPFLFAKKNFVHFQVPFTNKKGKKLLNRIKLWKINSIFCNSKFTKKFIDQEYGVNSLVIYPPVDVKSLKSLKKKKMILSVGRLGEPLNNKKQEVLVAAFKQMLKTDKQSLFKDWRLVLVGGLKKGDEPYLEALKKEAKGLPVQFIVNARFEELKKLYGQASLFWHAAGYGEDEKQRPERMEHFGIVVVEAMAAGCVPVAVKKGGIPEIIRHQKNGLLWEEKEELTEMTCQLVKSPALLKQLASQAVKDSQQFSKKVFCQRIDDLIKD